MGTPPDTVKTEEQKPVAHTWGANTKILALILPANSHTNKAHTHTTLERMLGWCSSRKIPPNTI